MQKKHLVALILAFFAMIQFAFAAININTATESELETLKGIGPVKAKAIVEYRQKNGSFKTIEDIKNVKGIGDKTFDKLKDQLTVSGTPAAAPAKDDAKSPKGGKKASQSAPTK